MQPLGVGVEKQRRQSNKATIKATSKLNPQTGIVSKTRSNFSTENWGEEMSHYLRSIEKMKEGSLEEIVVLAKPLMSPLKKNRSQETSSGSQSLAGGPSNLPNFHSSFVDEW